MSDAGAPPSTFEGAIVVVPQHCRGCGYELRGLAVDGRCPECGLEVMATLVHTVDPAASRLPRLRDPAGVGNGLVLVVITQTLAALLIGVRPVTTWADRLSVSGLPRFAAWTPPLVELLAVGLSLLGLLGVRWLSPGSPEDRSARRDVRRVGVGIIAAAVLVVLGGLPPGSASGEYVGLWGGIEAGYLLPVVPLAAAVTYALVGFKGVLATIGLRSRAYRTSRGGRQRVRDIIVALWGGVAGLIVQALAPVGRVELIGLVIAGICGLMLLIGMAYMVANAWWIRRSLRRPAPRLAELVGDRLPDDAAAEPDPEAAATGELEAADDQTPAG